MTENQTLARCEPSGASEQALPNSPPHILVVEDDNSLRELNTAALLQAGYTVDEVVDGAEAWQALTAESYDLIITDNNMPKISGVELLKQMRAAQMALPVIMATGSLPKEEFTRHAWLQPTAMLLKPYTISELLQTVKKVLAAVELPTGAAWKCPTNFSERILVADPDHDLRRLYAEALAGPGYDVDGAEDGAAAWRALQVNQYSLLITEHDLPQVNGVELVRKMRAAHLDVPVVMAAGRLPTDALAQNPTLQLAATLAKPFALEQLLATVKKVLRASDNSGGPFYKLPEWRRPAPASGVRF